MSKALIRYIPPVLASCNDRSVISPEHPTIQGPETWRDILAALDHNLLAVTFDFFVDWSNPQLPVADEFWFKFPMETDFDFVEIDHETLKEVLRGCRQFTDLVNFVKVVNRTAKAVMFKATGKFTDSSQVIIFNFNGVDRSTSFEVITVGELKSRIRKLSGGAISIGNKGLGFANTLLECHLSKTDALWPGDVDLLVCDRQEGKPSALIEFKKHTRNNTRNTFEEQCLELYYPRPDGRKYNRLAALARSFGMEVPIFIVFYCNYEGQNDILIQQVTFSGVDLIGGEVRRVTGIQSPQDVVTALRALL